MATTPYLTHFLEDHRLPESYLVQAETYFSPILVRIMEQRHQKTPIILGINGSQGSGKTTLADYLRTRLKHEHKLNVVSLSIDDFYLTKAERLTLSESVHPLLKTRGVPGTHDMKLAKTTLSRLRSQTPETVAIPRFNKACDDRHPESNWDSVQTPIDIIILEGWCVGSPPQPESALEEPINTLEKEEDKQGLWRTFSNRKLATEYADLFQQVDTWVMLQAPSFDCVYQWRLQQEKKLAEKLQQQSLTKQENTKTTGVMSDNEIKRFVQFYQRITEHTLKQLPKKVDFLFTLNTEREIQPS